MASLRQKLANILGLGSKTPPMPDVDLVQPTNPRSGAEAPFLPASRNPFSWLPGAKRDAAIAKLQEGYYQVVDLIGAMRSHMDSQERRGDQLLVLMENLPQALRSIPEALKNQEQIYMAMHSHLQQHVATARQFGEAVSSLASAADHHSQVLGVIQQQLDSNNHTNQQLTGGFQALNRTLHQINEHHQRSYALLDHFTAHTEKADARIQSLLTSNRKHMTLLTVLTWLIALLTLSAAAYVGYSVSKLHTPPPQTAPAQPGAPATPAEK